MVPENPTGSKKKFLFFSSSTPYIRYFVAHILEYSFYKTLCLEAEQYDPLDPTKYNLHFYG